MFDLTPRTSGSDIRPAKTFAPQTRCATSTCVEIEGTGTGYVFTNSTPGVAGSVTYSPEETATFVQSVKDGLWDDLLG